MSFLSEELARAQMSARLGEAHHRRQGHQLALARRLSRKAEQAMLQGLLVKASMDSLLAGQQDPATRTRMLAQAKQDVAGLPPGSRAKFESFFESLDGLLATPELAPADAGAGGAAVSPLPG